MNRRNKSNQGGGGNSNPGPSNSGNTGNNPTQAGNQGNAQGLAQQAQQAGQQTGQLGSDTPLSLEASKEELRQIRNVTRNSMNMLRNLKLDGSNYAANSNKMCLSMIELHQNLTRQQMINEQVTEVVESSGEEN